MKPENKKFLIETYPGWFDEYVLQCGDGWFQLIIDLCEEIKQTFGDIPNFKFSQVKEKFGGLRAYTNPTSEKVYSIIHKYEVKSFTICEDCGAPGEHSVPNGTWIRTLCPTCVAEAARDKYL